MSSRQVQVFTHGHCFDGLASAALFTKLLRHLNPADALEFRYHASGYGPKENGVPEGKLSGDITAILDYRFTPSSKLTWYFDHHVSAFASDNDRMFYSERNSLGLSAMVARERRFFHDGAYTSCTKLIADVGKQHFALDLSSLRELISWADMIDSASFPSAQMAVERREPVLQLMTVVEQHGDDAFLTGLVPRLLTESLASIASAPEVQERFAPIRAAHQQFVEDVKLKAEKIGHCVFVDLSEAAMDVAPKFVTYALYPESAYSVVLTASKSKCKISIGHNPWSSITRTHNIAAICERHGGGGHPVVGAISLPTQDREKAQALARKISEELST